MRICLAPAMDSRALHRVAAALQLRAPRRVSFTTDPAAADLVVLHVVGRRDAALRQARATQARGSRYAVIQYCLRSTLKPRTQDWAELWSDAAVVWSYYDLPALIAEDGAPRAILPRFFSAPLGAEASVFTMGPRGLRAALVASSGFGWLTESVREIWNATRRVGGRMWHLGPDLGRREPDLEYVSGVTDASLAARYQRTQYVSGLRRIEGFELPALEGLLCGARPLLFDRPHYRRWYRNFADYIPEGDRDAVIAALVDRFQQAPRPVTPAERAAAAEQFSWAPIAAGFWERVL